MGQIESQLNACPGEAQAGPLAASIYPHSLLTVGPASLYLKAE